MATESHEFKTELKQLLDIIIHSLYSNREIFLRELVSNACDAVDKVRFESLTATDLLEGDDDWKIKITADKDAGTLTVSDNGIGMSQGEIMESLGTIARSGTQAFMTQLKDAEAKDRPELIGQFGVGFYASLMVADRVEVVSRRAGAGSDAVRWETEGQGTFTVEAAERASRGTDVILHLKDDAKEFLEPARIRSIVRRYSDFIEHPITMDREEEKEEDGEKVKTTVEDVLNSQKALWLRPKDEISDEDLKEFYHHVAHAFDDPLKTIHFAAEGTHEFTALMFLPGKRPFDLYMPDMKHGLQLYVKRVFIMDNCEKLLPPWLRFVKGVVDSSDLPLNVSRELLQENPLLDRIRGALVKKVLATLTEMKDEAPDDYLTFWREFGAVLKEGLTDFSADRDKMAELMLFDSTATDGETKVSLADYVQRMPVKQKDIYYLIGDDRARLAGSPYLEKCRAEGFEVLLLTDSVDEWAVNALGEYEGRKLTAVDRGDFEADDEDESPEKKETEAKFEDLCKLLGDRIDEVKSVRLSSRLAESAACLVADEGDPGANMERLLKKMGRGEEMPEAKRILELNAAHPAVEALQALHKESPDDPRVEDYARLLYDQAVIAEGSTVKDPAAMARRINALLARDAGK